MTGKQADTRSAELSSIRCALDHVHRLLLRPAAEQPSLADLLADLAGAFAAQAAGLAGLTDPQAGARFPARQDEPAPLPWHDDPAALDRAGPVPGVALFEPPDGAALLATAVPGADGTAWVLWLEGTACTLGTETLAAAFALAASALSRWLHRGGTEGTRPRWVEQLDRAVRQQNLEVSAAVTRRLAHDFGNVLTGILGFTELALAQQVPANTSLHSYISEVYRAAQAGAQLTQQLRLFSRRQAGSSRSCPVNAVLTEQETRLCAAREAGVNLRLNLPTDLPPVALDSEHLGYILSALLDNAREALLGPGSISVSARAVELGESECRELFGSLRPGPHVEVIIADTGIGLSPEVQKRLFSEPFFTTKPRRRGCGLAVAYGILQAHRGGFRLYPGEERGVVARVLLPVFSAPRGDVADAPARAGVLAPAVLMDEVARPAERTRGERARGDRVLVVDDEPDILRFVGTSLENAGFRVDGVTSGEAALSRYFSQQGDPYRLVLTDVRMPGIGGVELVRRLLERDPGVRVLFMSGHVSADFTKQDFAQHSFEMLTKPFRPDHLVRAVRANIDRQGRRPAGETVLASSTRK
jgi:signal transduction histidine kinase/ActR/RegA family two-component response regulator